MFESTSKGKTYLVVDKDFNILAYFTLALKCLKLGDSVSKSKTKRIDGLSKDIGEVPVYLLGQLGKDDTHGSKVSGSEILYDHVFPLVTQALNAAGGRIVLVECRSEPRLIEFYLRNGFEFLQQDDDLTQLVRFLV